MTLYIVRRVNDYCYDLVDERWCSETEILAIFKDKEKAYRALEKYERNALDIGLHVREKSEMSIMMTATDTGSIDSFIRYWVEELEVETDLG